MVIRPTSIHKRLLIRLLLGLLVVFAVSRGIQYFSVRAALDEQGDADLLAKAHAIANVVTQQPDGSLDLDYSAAAMPEFGAKGRSCFQVWRSDGSVLGRSPSLGSHELVRDDDVTARPRYKDIHLADGKPARLVELQVVPVIDQEEQKQAGLPPGKIAAGQSSHAVVAVAQLQPDLGRTMSLLGWSLFVVPLLMTAGLAVIVALTLRTSLRPLEQVARRTTEINAGSLDIRFPTGGLPSELVPICRHLNELLARLEASFERERRFTADVAHELRTPIAELRALADVSVKWHDDPETVATYFKDVRAIAQQMEAVVGTLLALARCQSGLIQASCQSIVLREIVQDAWKRYEDQAESRRLAVSFEIPESLMLESDHNLLRSILENLLSNAVEYSSPGRAMDCRAEMSGSQLRLTVSNHTDSLASDDLPHVFEPFWRKDPARTDTPHAGLGLTLVAAYAEVLGGRVEATLRDGTLRVAIVLPSHSAVPPQTSPCPPDSVPGR